MNFDVLVLGTGLTESITAAALAKRGYKILQIDDNPYYGGDEASLSPDELLSWSKVQSGTFTSKSVSATIPEKPRQYSLSLAPSIIPSKGALITSLIASGVARYSTFKLLDRAYIYTSGILKDVPTSREDIFKSRDIDLLDKRKLMRFLVFASGQFEELREIQGNQDRPFPEFLENVFQLNRSLVDVVSYALALCVSPSDGTLPALERARLNLQSAGRYGPSSFLIGQYGGLGEIVQQFCRICAVAGGTYILGHPIVALNKLDEPPLVPGGRNSKTPCYQLDLQDIPEPIFANVVISSQRLNRSNKGDGGEELLEMQTGIAIIVVDSPLVFPHSAAADAPDAIIDNALIVYPPNSLEIGKAHGAVSVLMNGEGSSSCPFGKHVFYFSSPLLEGQKSSPQELLQPYIDQTLSLLNTPSASLIVPTFTTFYTRNFGGGPPATPEDIIECSPLVPHLSTNADKAVLAAETIFKEALIQLGESNEMEAMWPALPVDSDEEDD